MRFEDLSEVERERANAAIRAILEVETKRGLQLIEDDNGRRLASARPQLTNGPLAKLECWPQVLLPGPYSGPAGEQIRTSNGTCILTRGKTGYLNTRAQWTAKPRVLGVLKELGIKGLEAEKVLSRWFIISFGVAAVLRAAHPTLRDCVLVGARSSNVGSNQGALSLPAGLVNPKDSLPSALAREVGEEVTGITFAPGEVQTTVERFGIWTFGPHNVAPSVTFCASMMLGMDHPLAAEDLAVRANREWVAETLVWTPETEVRDALNGDLASIQARFAPHGIEVMQGFAPDVADPLAEQLNCWFEGFATAFG
jgi:ADP-ribose pyrophosphatase YjhB (NUDIX family)